MKSQFFCAHHETRMRQSEVEAMQSWMEMMRRGIRAYAKCQVDKAYTYLNAAVDITCLRATCGNNAVFDSLHVTKPTEFILQLLIAQEHYQEAWNLLTRLAQQHKSDLFPNNVALTAFLANHHHRLEEHVQPDCASKLQNLTMTQKAPLQYLASSNTAH